MTAQSNKDTTPAIYLAGPDVFHPASSQIGGKLQTICSKHRLVGLYPADNAIPLDIPDAASRIYASDIAMINRSAAVVANISPFRGPNMDPGTAFEIGYAVARGIPVFIYTDGVEPWSEAGDWDSLDEKLFPKPSELGLPENLMCVVPTTGTARTAEDAIVLASQYIHSRLELSVTARS